MRVSRRIGIAAEGRTHIVLKKTFRRRLPGQELRHKAFFACWGLVRSHGQMQKGKLQGSPKPGVAQCTSLYFLANALLDGSLQPHW